MRMTFMALAVAALVSAAEPAQAQLVTFQFSGRVTYVGIELAADVSVGEPVIMQVTWDLSSIPNLPTLPTLATYQHGIQAWRARIGAHVFKLVNTSGVNHLYVFDNVATPDMLGMYLELTTQHFAGPYLGAAGNLGLWYLESQVQYPGSTWATTKLPAVLPSAPSSGIGRVYFAEPSPLPWASTHRSVEFSIRKVVQVRTVFP